MVHVWYGASVGIKKQGQQITAVPVLISSIMLLCFVSGLDDRT